MYKFYQLYRDSKSELLESCSIKNRWYCEMMILLSAPIIYVAISLNIKASFVDLFSIIVAILSYCILLVSSNTVLIIIAFFIMFTIKVWDWVDGEVARRTGESGIMGHLLDETTSIVIDDMFILFLVIDVAINLQVLNTIPLIILVYLRVNKLKNNYYRILLTNKKYLLRITRKKRDIKSHDSQILDRIIHFLRLPFWVINYNVHRVVALTLMITRFTNYDISMIVVYLYITLYGLRLLFEMNWIKNKELLNQLYLE